MANIGFIGLGHMGLPMAINLIKSGHSVMGFDLQKQAMETLRASGGSTTDDLQELVKQQEVIITMLQTGQQVKQVCLGDKGWYAAGAGLLHIDCSSIDVQSSRMLHEQAQKNHLRSVDAPVSGGVSGARAGTLTFMVGGSEENFNQALPLLSAMGKKIIYTGAAGSGQAAKICNNMILGISMIGISEAFVLARKLGLSDQKLFEVVNSSSGQCWAMSNYAPVPDVLPNVPANNDYQPGFTAAMMLKDLLLSQSSAADAGVETILGQQAAALYQQFIDAGNGDIDFSAVVLKP